MRYQYTSSGFKNNYSTPFNITNAIKKIILVNIIIFILTEISGQRNSFFMIFGLVPHSITNEFKLWQIFTYMFMHGGILHILFNMFIWSSFLFVGLLTIDLKSLLSSISLINAVD